MNFDLKSDKNVQLTDNYAENLPMSLWISYFNALRLTLKLDI